MVLVQSELRLRLGKIHHCKNLPACGVEGVGACVQDNWVASANILKVANRLENLNLESVLAE